MRVIVRQAAALLLCLAMLYIGLLGVSLALVSRPDRGQGLDASLAGSTIFMTEPKYIYLNRTPLRSASEKIVLLGASNADVGFNLAELRPLLPSTTSVHKLAIGGANITEIEEVIDLVQQVQTEEARRHEIVVLGIWYGMFGEDRFRWYTPDRSPGDTDIDIERYRYGFERRTPQGPVVVVPWQYLDDAVTATYPFLLLDKISRDGVKWLSDRYRTHPKDLDTAIMTEKERDHSMDYWSTMMGPANGSTLEEQFKVLERSCERLLTDGSGLILVDLPLPRWHKQRSPYQSYYEKRKMDLVKRWADRRRFAALDMQDLDGDGDFYDEVHPRPHVTQLWARRLAGALTEFQSANAEAAGGVSDSLSPESQIP